MAYLPQSPFLPGTYKNPHSHTSDGCAEVRKDIREELKSLLPACWEETRTPGHPSLGRPGAGQPNVRL